MPSAALTSGPSTAGVVGKTAFDGSGNLWIPFCGEPSNFPNGLVAAFGPAALRALAARRAKVKPVAVLQSGTFNCPRSVAFDGSGNLWVANTGLWKGGAPPSLVSYGAGNKVITSDSFNFPEGISFDSAGNLWVADGEASAVYKFTEQQQSAGGKQAPTLTVISDFDFPGDELNDVSGNLIVSYGSGKQRPQPGPGAVEMFAASDLSGSGTVSPTPMLTLGGQTPCSILNFCNPHGIALDENGDLFVSEYRQILEYSRSQLSTGRIPLAQRIFASNYLKNQSLNENKDFLHENFAGALFLTFGPHAP